MTTTQTPTADNAILSKIIKLLKLAESSNVHEASAAAARAAELMAKYELDAADLALAKNDGKRTDEPIGEESVFTTKQRDGWRGVLLYGVALGYGCRSFTRRTLVRDKDGRWAPKRYKAGPDKGKVVFNQWGETQWETEVNWMILGRPNGVSAAKYTYSYLLNEIERLCKQAYRALPDWERPLAAAATAWYTSFKVGAAEEVSRRMCERRQQVQQSANNSQALVLVRQDEAAVDKAYKDMKLRTAPGYSVSRGDAYTQGRKAGRNINLDGGRGLNRAPNLVED